MLTSTALVLRRSSLAFGHPVDAHEISPFVKMLLEAAVEGVLGGFADPARPLCQDNRWLGSEATGRLARWLKSRTAAIAFRR